MRVRVKSVAHRVSRFFTGPSPARREGDASILRKKGEIAFSFIEMIAVIAVVAVLAGAILPVAIRHLDVIAGKKEEAALNTIAEAIKRRITVNKLIANHPMWVTNVAIELGWNPNQVTNNIRNLRRVFMIHPALVIGTNGSLGLLPYTQSVVGHNMASGSATVPPVSPRLMLVSSIGPALPSALASGVNSALGVNSFNNIWNTADGAVPSGWTWGGRGEDLKIRRIDLGDLFVQVILNNRDSTNTPTYRIDDSSTNAVPYGGRRPAYFLKGSELRLNNAFGTNEYSEILQSSQSFTFEFGTWTKESFTVTSVSDTSAIDLQRVMHLFVAAPTNYNAKAASSQITASNAMVNYMNEFISWRAAGYSPSKAPSSLSSAQSSLDTISRNLITSGSVP